MEEKELMPEKKVDSLKNIDIIKELAKSVEPIVVVNGVIQIDPSHPSYKFLIED